MKSIVIATTVIASLTVGSVLAAEMPKEGIRKCSACHAMDKRLIGPSWKDVAAKYQGKADAQSTLEANIMKGGSFGWKMGAMPPKGAGATEAEIQSLAKFIVDIK